MSIESSPTTQQKRAWAIGEWCARWDYSRPHFYKMRATGDAPDVIGVGKAQRVTDVAEARWLKQQERKARARAK
jgi:hypothetical protein